MTKTPAVRSPRDGVTLVELLVAVLLLQILALSLVAAVLAAERATRRLGAATRRDQVIWQDYQAAAVTDACRQGGPRVVAWPLPPLLPEVPLVLGCGQ